MNILFLTLICFESLQERNIYTDLLRVFVKKGHHVYAISPIEKRLAKRNKLIVEDNATILKLRIGNTQKTNIIKKGISTIMIEPSFKSAINKYFSDVRFDLVVYTTPPITFSSAVEYIKKRDGAKTYLLLKDIFPQNAVDLGLLSKTGPKSLLYKHFRKQEKKLYGLSDHIRCMSQANVDYVLKHNHEIDPTIVEVCPNSVEVIDKSVDEVSTIIIRNKYNIPLNKTVFVYGGNLGKPQGINFLIECMKKCRDIDEVYFLIIGDGTEYGQLEKYALDSQQANLRLMRRLPKEDYDTLVGACDVGMIFLDCRFTIPNFPSRLLSYMQAKIPVLAATDSNTDLGRIILRNDFGWWCESSNAEEFRRTIKLALQQIDNNKGVNAYDTLIRDYSVEEGYRIIISVCSRTLKYSSNHCSY